MATKKAETAPKAKTTKAAAPADQWEAAPPPPRTPNSGRPTSERNAAIAEKLKSNPGMWTIVAEGEKTGNLAVRIRKGQVVAFREGRWDAKVRTQEDRTKTIWAAYLGE